MNLFRRRVHRPTTDSLPAAGWKIMLDGFAARRPYVQIAIDLAKAGFHVSQSAVSRRAVEWRGEQRRLAANRPPTQQENNTMPDVAISAEMPGGELGGRRSHRSTDSLPPEAWVIMLAGFKSRRTYAAIAQDLIQGLGIEVPERTIARRCLEWRNEQRRELMLRELARIGSAGLWSFSEIMAAIEHLDLRAGCVFRGRKAVRLAVTRFLEQPTQEKAHVLEVAVLRLALISLLPPKIPQEEGSAGV